MPRHIKKLNALFMLAALAAAATAHAGDPGCKPLLASLSKYIDTPSHTYSESSKGPQGVVQKTETINTGTQRFLLSGGRWMLSKMTTEDLKAQTQQNLSSAHCQYVRDDVIGADNTALYAFKVSNDLANSDGHLWISKRSGLPIKQDQTVHLGDTPAEAMHLSQRMSYDDVKAPSGGH